MFSLVSNPASDASRPSCSLTFYCNHLPLVSCLASPAFPPHSLVWCTFRLVAPCSSVLKVSIGTFDADWDCAVPGNFNTIWHCAIPRHLRPQLLCPVGTATDPGTFSPISRRRSIRLLAFYYAASGPITTDRIIHTDQLSREQIGMRSLATHVAPSQVVALVA